jgi:putative Ca2+/H+ antiporter (TMEM165/GDT1 family)
MDERVKKVVGLHKAEFAKAVKYHDALLWVQLTTVVIAASTMFVKQERSLNLLAGIAFLATACWVWISHVYASSRGAGERGRRAVMLMDGLGVQLSDSEYRSILANFTVSSDSGKQEEDETFYSSDRIPSPLRLADHIDESAFWSSHLLRLSSQRYWVFFSVTAAIAVLLAVAVLPALSGNQSNLAARLLALIVSFVVSQDVLGRALAYSRGANQVSELAIRAQAVKACKTGDTGDLFTLFGDYNSAVEGSPMFVPGVYSEQRVRLNKLWSLRS